MTGSSLRCESRSTRRRSLAGLAAIASASACLAISPSLSVAALASGHPRTAGACRTPPHVAPEAGAALAISASTAKVGCIELTVHGAAAPQVSIAELAAGSSPGPPLAVLSTRDGEASLPRGLPWSCERRSRAFEVSETLPDGSVQSASTSVETPSCATRLSVRTAPERVHRGYPATLLVSDRWRLGDLRVEACLGAGRRPACTATTLAPGPGATPLRLSPRAAGQTTVDVADAYERLAVALHVLGSQPTLLATGDSEMQVLDDDLAGDLSGAGMRVASDARQSTAISSPSFFDWPAHAFAQVAGIHPDVVAMFLGGNEGFRLGNAECCGSDWSREYAKRVAGMMRVYRQDGAAEVYWFLIPTPRSEPFVRVMRAVNDGIVEAAAEFPEGVHVFDLRPVFSPGGRYIDSLTRDGHTIAVHEPDGFHLSESADVIVAHMFVARLREEGVVP